LARVSAKTVYELTIARQGRYCCACRAAT
jgi:hypothetical protein